MNKDNTWKKARQLFSEYLKEQFIKEGEVIKDNFQELWEDWRGQLDDEDLDKYAEDWRMQDESKAKIKNALQAIEDAVGDDYQILELVKKLLED